MADSLNRRDIDMIFRAETDGATRSVGELKKSVAGLRQELTNQIGAAERGEASLDDLAATVRQLKQAQDELGTARGLLTNLNTLVGQQEKAVARTETLRRELAELQAQATATDNPLKSLTATIAKKERALAAAEGKEQQMTASLAEQRQQIEAIIGPITNFRESFETIARTAKDVAQGLAISGNAADDFQQSIKRAAAAQADLDDFTKFATSAGVLQEDIAFLAQFEDRIERVTAARNAQVAADMRFQDVLEETIATQARLEQTNAFRQTAEGAREAFRDVTRFGAAAEAGEGSVRRLATAVADLANPALAASRDFEQVAAKVDEIAARTEKGAKGVRLGVLSDDLNDLEQALAALQRQAAMVDGLRDQQAATAKAEAQFASAKTEVFALANALDQAGADGAEQAMALRQAEGAAEAAGLAWQREATKLVQLGEAAEGAGLDIKNLDATEQRLITTSGRAGQAADKLRRHLGGGRGGGGAFLGLKPYELQNLGFQIQDIFIGLTSGQKPLTVLFQQGSQISQIFPGMWAALARGLPIIAPLVIAFGALAAGMGRARSQAKELREIGAALVQIGDDGTYSKEGLQDSIDALDDLGASGEDARKAILSFVKEGLDPTFIDDFAVAAKNLSEITGEELPEAADKLIEAFTGGRDSVLALDDEFQFLSESERTQIRAMDDSTDAAEIRTIAFDAFFQKAQDVAAELRGPSTEAVITLENAWDNFLDTLADVAGFESVDEWLANLTNGIAVFVEFLTLAIRQLKNSFGLLAKVYREQGIVAALGSINDIVAQERSGSELKQQALANVAGGIRDRRSPRRSSGDPGRGTRGARGIREAVADRKAKKTGKSEAEKLAEQLEREQEQMTRALESMTSKAIVLQNQSIEQQLESAAAAVKSEYAKLFRDLEDFREKFGPDAKIGDLTQEQFRQQVEANQALIIQQQQLRVFEEGLNDLLNERKEKLSQIEERQDAGLITAQQAYADALEVTSELNPRVERIAEMARAFATAIGGAEPSPALREFLAKLDGIGITLGETRLDVTKAALANLNEIETDRNDILERRDRLIAANNELVKLGLMTQSDAREQAVIAYNREGEALRALIVEERAYLAVLLENRAISQTFFDARMAELMALEAQTQYVDDRILQINNAAQGAFTGGFTTMFDTLAQGLANLITGGGSVGDMLTNLGMAALSFAADFLKAIADVMVQMLALQALKAIMGAGSGGLGAFFFHSGTGPGGVGGYGGGTRHRTGLSISPAMVSAIPRYHQGTSGAGLGRNEMLAVLERGERVVTEEQDRLAAKGQGTGGGRTPLRQVLAFGDSEVAGAMAGKAGEEVILTQIRRNRPRIRQELGID